MHSLLKILKMQCSICLHFVRLKILNKKLKISKLKSTVKTYLNINQSWWQKVLLELFSGQKFDKVWKENVFSRLK